LVANQHVDCGRPPSYPPRLALRQHRPTSRRDADQRQAKANTMSVVATTEEGTAPSRVVRRATPAAALASLGIVYGDLGTSPLYTLQAVIQTTGGHFTPEVALGVLSLILWALVITISLKYCLFVMRADKHGEGGILALMPLAGATAFDRSRAPSSWACSERP
jgi:hypothetical protein